MVELQVKRFPVVHVHVQKMYIVYDLCNIQNVYSYKSGKLSGKFAPIFFSNFALIIVLKEFQASYFWKYMYYICVPCIGKYLEPEEQSDI